MENQIITVNKAEIEAADWLAKRDTLVTQGKAITKVTSGEELEVAGKFETDCKKHIKALAEIRLRLTRPLDAAKRDICDREKSLIKAIDAEQKRVNVLTTAYANELARRAEEERLAQEAAERERAEAELAAQEAAEQAAQANAAFGLAATPVAPAPAPAAVPVPMVTTTGPHTNSNRFVEKWDFAITDPNAVPRELCSPDPAKIRALMNAKKAEGYKAVQIVVPGVKFSSSMQVYSR